MIAPVNNVDFANIDSVQRGSLSASKLVGDANDNSIDGAQSRWFLPGNIDSPGSINAVAKQEFQGATPGDVANSILAHIGA